MRAAAEISDKLFDTRASSETGNEALDRQKTGSRIAPYPKNQLQKEGKCPIRESRIGISHLRLNQCTVSAHSHE